MAAFNELDWRRFDVWAAVAGEGIASIEPTQRGECRAWLRRNGYRVESIDFGDGIGPAVVEMGKLFRWEEEFGYPLTHKSRNLDAIRDGFEFDQKPGSRCVLELLDAEVAHAEDSRWFCGLLSIAHEYSRWQLATGSTFFVTLYHDHNSPLVGVAFEELRVPGPLHRSGSRPSPFTLPTDDGQAG